METLLVFDMSSSSHVGWQNTLGVLLFFYYHYRTLVLFLLPGPVAVVIVILVKSILSVLFPVRLLPTPTRQVYSFRLGVSVIWVLARRADCVGLVPVCTDVFMSEWVFPCLWSDFCLTYTTGTPHSQRGHQIEQISVFFFLLSLLHRWPICYQDFDV